MLRAGSTWRPDLELGFRARVTAGRQGGAHFWKEDCLLTARKPEGPGSGAKGRKPRLGERGMGRETLHPASPALLRPSTALVLLHSSPTGKPGQQDLVHREEDQVCLAAGDRGSSYHALCFPSKKYKSWQFQGHSFPVLNVLAFCPELVTS